MIIANTFQLIRLEILHRIVFPKVLMQRDELSLDYYFHECGTPMCLGGYAAVEPLFKEMGMNTYSDFTGTLKTPSYRGLSGLLALDLFFGTNSSNILFGVNEKCISDYHVLQSRREYLGDYLKENGITN